MYCVALMLCALVASSYGLIQCTPQMCEGVEKGELNCAGDKIVGGGFCGCTDTCAGVDDEPCTIADSKIIPLLGASPVPPCSSGYECVKKELGDSLIFSRFGKNGVCKKIEITTTTTARPKTQCERTRMLRMISFAIWKGQWTPKCYLNGDFMPKQCDNTGKQAPKCYLNGDFMPKQCDNTGACFCVTRKTGVMIVGSKKQGQNVTC